MVLENQEKGSGTAAGAYRGWRGAGRVGEGRAVGVDAAAVEPNPLHVLFSAAATTPGAPCPPSPRQVQGLRGDRATGEGHDVAISDLTLPKEAWGALCGWRFGTSPHRISSDRAVTCARCTARRVVGERRLALA